MTLELITAVASSVLAFRKQLLVVMMNGGPEEHKTLLIDKMLGDITFAYDYVKTHPLLLTPQSYHESTQAPPSLLASPL